MGLIVEQLHSTRQPVRDFTGEFTYFLNFVSIVNFTTYVVAFWSKKVYRTIGGLFIRLQIKIEDNSLFTSAIYVGVVSDCNFKFPHN